MLLQWRAELRTRIAVKSLLLLSFTLLSLSLRFVCALPISSTPTSSPADHSTEHPAEGESETPEGNFLILASTEKSAVSVFRYYESTPDDLTSSPFTSLPNPLTRYTKEEKEIHTSRVPQETYPTAESEPERDWTLPFKNDSEAATGVPVSDVTDAHDSGVTSSSDTDVINGTAENTTVIVEMFTRETDSMWLWILKATVMVLIILVSVLGNALVIVSVALHRRLHCAANYLLVSLATADMLVALCAMTFNASMELSGGRWLFGGIMCDLWNSFDVYFSTVSILHLCSISVDRYYAIVRPLEYPLTMTRQMLATMLAQAWLAPALISFLPIFLGWYTTTEHLRLRALHPNICIFQVNAVYAVLSSSVSFWVPCAVMMVMYFRIFQEARKQEHAIITRASSGGGSGRSNGTQQEMARQQLMVALQGSAFTAVPEQQEILMKTLSNVSSNASVTACADSVVGSGSSRSSSGGPISNLSIWRRQSRKSSIASWAGGSSAAHALNRRPPPLPPLLPPPAPPGRREHKAARTLGLIMGAFVLCWLPFFTWYVSINICGEQCHTPHAVVTTVFWIGYFNSTLNPFIYVYFRSDFRAAFQSTLSRLQCCKSQESSGVFV